MLRAVLLGVLSLTVVGCKSKTETVQSQAGVAGKVIEASGTVTLHHGSDAKPLAKGDSVEADDIIETGADGSVQIELAHNNATWDLGANKKVKVRESLAWNEAKKDRSAKAVEQDSAAAGRHAERNAADTTVSAAPAASEAAPAPAPPPAPIAAPAPRVEKAEKKTAPPPPPPAPTVQPPAPPKAAAPSPRFGAKGAIKADIGALSGGAPDGDGEGPELAARSKISAKLGDLKSCFKDPTKVTFKIDAEGRATLAYAGTVDAAAKSCAENVAKSITFAKAATSVTVDVKP